METSRGNRPREPLLYIALAALFCSASVVLVTGKEVLPPHAYFNRTIYPPIFNYTRKPQLSIGIVSDVQYADQEEHNRRHFRLSLGKLQHAFEEMNANRTHLDMVMHLGDLVDHTMDKYLPMVTPILKKLNYPLFQVLGNHDFLGSPDSKLNSIYTKLGMPSRYYSMAAGPNKMYRLVILDGNDLAIYSTPTGSIERRAAEGIFHKLKSRKARNANQFNGAIGAKQVEWMKGQLAEACEANQRVIIFLHHPMRPKGEPTNLWNDLEVVPIITSYHCVVAVINGHAHKFLYDFHYTRFRSVHFITFGGMVQSPFTSWGFAEFYDDVLHLHGLIFGRPISSYYDISYHKNIVPVNSTTSTPTILSAPLPPATTATASYRYSPSSTTSGWAVGRSRTPDDTEGLYWRSRFFSDFLTVFVIFFAMLVAMRLKRHTRNAGSV